MLCPIQFPSRCGGPILIANATGFSGSQRHMSFQPAQDVRKRGKPFSLCGSFHRDFGRDFGRIAASETVYSTDGLVSLIVNQ
jgi:hypothetical protein